MIRMFPRRRSHRLIVPGTDEVLFGLSLPSDTRLNGLSATVHVVGTDIIPASKALMYGIEAYILPVLDPDSAPTFETIWDTLVPKDNDTDTIDLDTEASDTASFYEPGESAMAEVMDVGLQPERVYNTQRLRSFATAGLKQESASVLEWSLSDVFKIHLGKNRRYRCDGPSVILFALGNPDLDDTSAVEPTALAENEWARVKYIGTVLGQALMKHFGLIEAGAETPWEDAALLLRKFLEPDVFEETAGAYTAQNMNVFCNVTFDISVPGEMEKIQIGTGG